MSDDLRSRVIRLAHAQPELRPHLLPVLKQAEDKSFEDAIKGKKFRNPETGNEVAFGSLPAEEQKKVRSQWKSKNQSKGPDSDDQSHPANAAKNVVKGLEESLGLKPGQVKAPVKEIEAALSKMKKEVPRLTFDERDIDQIISGKHDDKFGKVPGYKELHEVIEKTYGE